MLSIKPINNASQASHYYHGDDNYYFNEEDAQKQSEWQGRGAELLGLYGEVEQEKFEALLEGKLPNGLQVGAKNKDIKHRPGTDLTFSAPKSVSVLGLVGDDHRILKAHNEAVRYVLNEIEQEAAQARNFSNENGVGYENTKNVVIAKFFHNTSRAMDPQYHTHCVFLNVTQRSDGSWRALASCSKQEGEVINGFRERVYNNKMYYGALYRSVLSELLRSLGYETVSTGKNGLFEIKGVPKDLLESFSQRRAQVVEQLNEKGYTSSKASSFAALVNRPFKESMPEEDKFSEWKARCEAYDFDIKRFILSADKESLEAKVPSELTPIVQEHADRLSNVSPRFSKRQLISNIILKNPDLASVSTLENVIDKMSSSKNGLILKDGIYTTQKSEQERTLLIEKIKENKECKLALIDKNEIADIRNIINNEKNATILSLSRETAQNNRNTLVQGTNSLFPKIRQILSNNTQTVAQFITEKEQLISMPFGKSFSSKSPVFVDISTNIGIKETTKIIEICDKLGKELTFIGYKDNNNRFGHDILEILKNHVVHEKTKITSIQKEKCSNTVIVESDNTLKVAAETLAGQLEEGKESVIFTSSKKEESLLNENIRDVLKQKSILGDKSLNITTNNPILIDNELAKKASSYKKADLLRISSRNGSSNWFVTQIDGKNNALTLSGEHTNRSKKLILDKIDFKNQFVSKIDKCEIEVREGEILRTSSRMYEHNIESNTDLKVKKIVPGFLVLNDGKRSIILSKTTLNNAPLKYGYTKSLHTTSSKRYDTTVSILKPYQANKSNIGKINTLSKSSSIIVTEDKEKAIKYSHRETNRVSAISADNYSRLSIQAGNILNKISETTAVFSKQDYFKEAISIDKDYTQSKLNTDIENAVENGYLIEKDYSDGSRYIFSHHLKMEKDIHDHITNGKSVCTPLVNENSLKKILDGKTLTKGQKSSISNILTTKDRFHGIQGLAGTGKSTAFTTVKSILDAKNSISNQKTNVIALAPTHQAVSELKEKGLESQTVQGFISDMKGFKKKISNNLYLVDESSMINTQDFKSLMDIFKEGDSRAVFTGDVNQIQGFSGKPFDVALSTLNKSILADVVRQKNKSLNDAVRHLANGNLEEALVNIDSSQERKVFHEFKNDKNKTIEEAAKHYASMSESQRQNTIMIVQTNKDREQINIQVRDELQKNNQISKKDEYIQRLTQKNVDTTDIRQYKKGDTVNHKNQYYVVKSVSKEQVQMEGDSSRTIVPKVFSDAERKTTRIYSTEKLAVSIGEKIRIRSTIDRKGIKTNDEFTIKSIDNGVIKYNETSSFIDTKLPDQSKWDYAYSTTGYSAQSQTKENVIDVMLSDARRSTNLRSFYVSVSRTVNSIDIFTDNKQESINSLERSIGESNKSAIEVYSNKRLIDKSQFQAEISFEEKKKTYTSHKPQYSQNLNKDKIKSALIANATHVAIHLLGEPNAKFCNQSELRWGNKGSFKVSVSGEGKGYWQDFEGGANDHGDLISLIQNKLNLDFKGALEYAADLTNSKEYTSIESYTSSEKSHSNDKMTSSSRSKYAKKIIDSSKNIEGSLAEKYLSDKRGINNITGSDLLFNPKMTVSKGDGDHKLPAMIAVVRDKEGQIQGLQATYLDPNTAEKADLSVVKKSLGQISGGTVTINNPSNPDAVSFIAEGVETALSIKDGFKNDHVVATLGKQNIHKIDPDSLKSVVIICADNDGKSTFLDKDNHIRDAAERIKNSGKEVFIALPGDIDNKQKLDFNDLESSEVREAIESALPSEEFNKQADDLQTQDILLEENESNQKEINQEFDQIEQEIF